MSQSKSTKSKSKSKPVKTDESKSKRQKGTKRKLSPADKVERLREEQRDILRAKGHDEKEVERQIKHIEEKYGARERKLEELMQKFEAGAVTREIEELAKKHEIEERAAKRPKTEDKKQKEKEKEKEEDAEEEELVDGGTRSPKYDPYPPSAPGEEEVFYTPLSPVPMDEGEIEYAPTSPSHDPNNKNCGCSFCIVDAEEAEAKTKTKVEAHGDEEEEDDAKAKIEVSSSADPSPPKAAATTVFKQGICGITYASKDKMEWVIGQIRAGLGISPLLASLHLQPSQIDWGYTAGEPVIFLSNAIRVESSDRDRIQAEILAMGFAVYS